MREQERTGSSMMSQSRVIRTHDFHAGVQIRSSLGARCTHKARTAAAQLLAVSTVCTTQRLSAEEEIVTAVVTAVISQQKTLSSTHGHLVRTDSAVRVSRQLRGSARKFLGSSWRCATRPHVFRKLQRTKTLSTQEKITGMTAE